LKPHRCRFPILHRLGELSMIATTVRIAKAFAVSTLMTALLGTPAWADEAADVRALLQARKLDEARAKANAFLAQQPNDAQMRFLMGLILSEQNRTDEAIVIFSRLTDDYPQLPEPHNNLAALYSATGQYDKARAALESALRANPNYAVARENLGDIYVKLASQAYARALEQDPGNAGARQKLSLSARITGDTTPPAAAQKPPVVEVRAAASTPQANDNSARNEAVALLQGWAKAWSEKDIDAYLGYYSDEFRPQSGLSHSKWKKQRRALISGKGRINVKAEEPKVEVDGNHATISFRQVYVSDRMSETSSKTLVLARYGNQWKIQQERAN
jgi:tetratricopeptide (TPR) repeat protein